VFAKTLLQRLFITLQFFADNGLANHAAACAYGFLLSAAPILLLVTFFLLAAFRSSPQAVAALAADIPVLASLIDADWLAREYLSVTVSGISGIISVAAIFWAGRIFALSMQRGLKVIFTGKKKRNPVTDNIAVVFIEILVFVVILAMIFLGALKRGAYILPALIMALAFYFVCRTITANAPGRVSLLWGTIFFAAACTILSILFQSMSNQVKYNFLYGALGGLVMLLVNVYVFFICFFTCAQFAKINDSFDALLFSRLRQSRMPGGDITKKLFFSAEGRLEKYLRAYKEDATIFEKGSGGNEIYYLLEGEVNVIIPSAGRTADNSRAPDDDLVPVNTLTAGSFFGEMGHLLSGERTATIKAKTSIQTLVLPPALFDEILQYDTGMDRTMLEHLSRRLKTRNEQFTAAVPFPDNSNT
jgi:membrane protein